MFHSWLTFFFFHVFQYYLHFEFSLLLLNHYRERKWFLHHLVIYLHNTQEWNLKKKKKTADITLAANNWLLSQGSETWNEMSLSRRDGLSLFLIFFSSLLPSAKLIHSLFPHDFLKWERSYGSKAAIVHPTEHGRMWPGTCYLTLWDLSIQNSFLGLGILLSSPTKKQQTTNKKTTTTTKTCGGGICVTKCQGWYHRCRKVKFKCSFNSNFYFLHASNIPW